jgi:hypothetical protein
LLPIDIARRRLAVKAATCDNPNAIRSYDELELLFLARRHMSMTSQNKNAFAGRAIASGKSIVVFRVNQ